MATILAGASIIPEGDPGPSGGTGSIGPSGPRPVGATVVSADSGNLATLGSDGKVSVPSSGIWNVRLRSYNAIGNPTFEVDQRNVGNSVAQPSWGVDRWNVQLGGTMQITTQQVAATVTVPGTNFPITRSILRMTLTTQMASLASGSYLLFQTAVEGSSLRELIRDVHSVSILARSSVANLSFGMALQDTASSTHVLVKLCTLGAANTWTLITLPNLPLWMPAGTWLTTAGSPGYYLVINLAAGSTYTIPANDVWQTSAAFGAVGQSNFAASPVNSTFDVAFVQHEPGSVCTGLMDKPFGTNLWECKRYYQKSAPYGSAAAGYGNWNMVGTWLSGYPNTRLGIRFERELARIPTTVTLYDNSGTAGKVYDDYIGSVPYSSLSFDASSILASNMATTYSPGYGTPILASWSADTGW